MHHAADNLFENKVGVVRGTGGGNVIAYNYMDDAYGATYPNLLEAGVNAGHYTTILTGAGAVLPLFHTL